MNLPFVDIIYSQSTKFVTVLLNVCMCVKTRITVFLKVNDSPGGKFCTSSQLSILCVAFLRKMYMYCNMVGMMDFLSCCSEILGLIKFLKWAAVF